MLHGRRKHLQQITQAEAEGQSFWTVDFDKRARARMASVVAELGDGAIALIGNRVSALMRKELGVFIRTNILVAFVEEDKDHLPSLTEALIAVRELAGSVADRLEREINDILNEHRISYELINGQMVEFESKELHQAVVAPVLRLLSGLPGWDNVEMTYQDALREVSQNAPGDAITDAGTALQEALTLLGCDGNSLGPLVRSAKSKGLLAPHDSTLTEGIEKIAHWVAADRSESGDSHKASTGITRDDAWFTVHVVGALILRLAGGRRTG